MPDGYCATKAEGESKTQRQGASGPSRMLLSPSVGVRGEPATTPQPSNSKYIITWSRAEDTSRLRSDMVAVGHEGLRKDNEGRSQPRLRHCGRGGMRMCAQTG